MVAAGRGMSSSRSGSAALNRMVRSRGGGAGAADMALGVVMFLECWRCWEETALCAEVIVQLRDSFDGLMSGSRG